jgi:hypothetical protein
MQYAIRDMKRWSKLSSESSLVLLVFVDVVGDQDASAIVHAIT